MTRLAEEQGVKRNKGEAATLAHAVKGAQASGRREWPAELVAEVLGRLAAGEAGEVIAAEPGLLVSSVYRLLKARVVLRPRSTRPIRDLTRNTVPSASGDE